MNCSVRWSGFAFSTCRKQQGRSRFENFMHKLLFSAVNVESGNESSLCHLNKSYRNAYTSRHEFLKKPRIVQDIDWAFQKDYSFKNRAAKKPQEIFDFKFRKANNNGPPVRLMSFQRNSLMHDFWFSTVCDKIINETSSWFAFQIKSWAPRADELRNSFQPCSKVHWTEKKSFGSGGSETKSIRMSSKSSGPQRCRLILQQCLAIQLSKAGNAPEDFWMYDSGYMIFQVS